MRIVTPPRVLAIAPGTRHLGYAVLEGAELVRFGVKSFPGKKRCPKFLSGACRFLDTVARTYAPTLVAVELTYYAQASLSPMLTKLIEALKRWSRRNHLRVAGYYPTTVKARVCTGKQTRQALAETLAARYVFLSPFLERRRTAVYWRQMFDAVALGTVAAEDRAGGHGGRTGHNRRTQHSHAR